MSDIWFPWTHPRARKEHKCDTCYRRIDPGEQYTRGSGVYDGRMTSFKMCAHCKVMLSFIDYDNEYGPEDFIEFEPASIPELRMKVYFNKRWRNNAGELYPIPEK
jgi:hypothetical protein